MAKTATPPALPVRKVIQLSSVGTHLYALCDDGSVWRSALKEKWERLDISPVTLGGEETQS